MKMVFKPEIYAQPCSPPLKLSKSLGAKLRRPVRGIFHGRDGGSRLLMAQVARCRASRLRGSWRVAFLTRMQPVHLARGLWASG